MRMMNKIDIDVLSVLPRGRENARTGKELCKLLGINERIFYSVIRRLRLKGVPVMSSRDDEPRGLYIATNELEKAQGVKPYESQYKNMRELLNALQSIKVDTWQQDFFNSK